MIGTLLAVVIVVYFLYAYLRHHYWFVRCWGFKSKDKIDAREFWISCLNIVDSFHTYGIWRIMAGTSVKAHKRMIKERSSGFNLSQAFVIVNV